jgi:sensor c-di-GMP phosphodiesterase-like protein
MDVARKIIAELQALGVRVALDDVGTGHGGLAYLQRLGIDIIKIDKMFIDYLGTDDNSTTIVDTLVELADNLGMGIIAEGVENIEQIERLRALGVSAAQGYIFAPPLPAKLFIDLAEALASKGSDLLEDGGDQMAG